MPVTGSLNYKNQNLPALAILQPDKIGKTKS